MGDTPVSPNPTNQRKLPIPTSAANTNSPLKDFLIKPKRILPSKPDNQKVKRTVQENTSECKAEETVPTLPKSVLNTNLRTEASSGGSSACSTPRVSVPKLAINVDRLKTYFQLQGNAVVRKEKRKTDLNENDIKYTKSESGTDKQPSQCSTPDEIVGVVPPLVSTDTPLPLVTTASDGLLKLKEWCPVREVDKIPPEMTSDPSMAKTLQRNIRSPSPKSNTTWDRSSSGYSSDERQDPRSPPPSHSASLSVSSKTETELTNEDDASISHTDDIGEDEKSEDENSENDQTDELDTLKSTDDLTSLKPSYIRSISADDLLSSDNDCNALTLTPIPASAVPDTEAASTSCEHCDIANTCCLDNSDTASSCVNFTLESLVTTKKRPVGTALPNPPVNVNGNRIQYRKSVSESVINLRQTSRNGASDSNLDGLAVCGKSFPQTSVSNFPSLKFSEASGVDVQRSETGSGNKLESISTYSAFTPIERPLLSAENCVDAPDCLQKTRLMRPPPALVTCRSPRDHRDIRGLNLGINFAVRVPMKDEFRRTLHHLSAPRHLSPALKPVPIRARHPMCVTATNLNQPMSAMDTIQNQPISTSLSRTSANESVGRNSNFSGKKMWRPPSGQPDNAQARPFSPFGGTLPPAKIKEQEDKKHHMNDNHCD